MKETGCKVKFHAAGANSKSSQGSAESYTNMPNKVQACKERSKTNRAQLLYPPEMTLHGSTSCCA